MPRELTAKQKTFIDTYMNCHNKSEAYRQAYNPSNTNSSYVSVKANDIYENQRVNAEIKRREALIREASDKADIEDAVAVRRKWSRADSVDALVRIYSASAEATRREVFDDDGFLERVEYNPAAANAATKAVEGLNKMLGYNEPDKSQVDAVISVDLGDFDEFSD